jgi:hypothetical protein
MKPCAETSVSGFSDTSLAIRPDFLCGSVLTLSAYATKKGRSLVRASYDAVNLVLPDIAGSFGISQDQASWFLTTYSSALFLGVPVSL